MNCTIIGTGHAGTTLALQLRKEGWRGPIRLIGAEAELPYHRPPLSKDFLAGDKELEAIRLRPLKAFKDNQIELVLGTTVLAVQAHGQILQLSDGESLRYDRLAVSTGSHVKTLQPASDLANVHYIRTVADVKPLHGPPQPTSTAGRSSTTLFPGSGPISTILSCRWRVSHPCNSSRWYRSRESRWRIIPGALAAAGARSSGQCSRWWGCPAPRFRSGSSDRAAPKQA